VRGFHQNARTRFHRNARSVSHEKVQRCFIAKHQLRAWPERLARGDASS
jgi:hypothetical protein